MNTKEAIEFLEDIYDWNTAPDIEDKVEDNIPKIIALLQQGEKYRQMWEKLEKITNGKDIYSNWLRSDIKKLEQKYFPKEGSQDYKEGEE